MLVTTQVSSPSEISVCEWKNPDVSYGTAVQVLTRIPTPMVVYVQAQAQ